MTLNGSTEDIALPSTSAAQIAEHGPIRGGEQKSESFIAQTASVPARLAWLGAAFALAGSALLVDPFAEAAFDAPKRSCAITGATFAAIALLWDKSRTRDYAWSAPARYALVFAALFVLCALIATIASAHQEVAWTSLCRASLYAACVPIGASCALDTLGGRRLFAVFVCSCGANAVISVLQTFGFQLPLHVVQLGGRFATGALLGNEGYVALASAILGAACAAILASDMRRRYRIGALGTCAICILAIVFNRQATSAVAFVAALAVIAAVRWRVHWIAAVLACLIAIAGATALIAPLRTLTWSALPVGGVEGYQRLTTYRLGAWVAAIYMAQARPLTGYGPGTYAVEQQPHRLQAELEYRERFVQPTGATFVYAHEEYLQLAAEAGIPATLFFLGALGALLIGLVRLPRAPTDAERAVLLAILTTGAVEALAWFPLQIPFTGTVLLLAAGRSWRIVAEGKSP